MSILSGIDAGINAATLGYNIFQGERVHQFMQEGRAREDTYHQRKRADLEAAGLNPALMYEGGGVGGSQPTPTQPAHDKKASIFDNALKDIQIAQGKKQIQMADAQIRNVNADTTNKQANTTASLQNLRFDQDKHPINLQQALHNITKTRNDYIHTSAQTDTLDAQRKLIPDQHTQQRIFNAMLNMRHNYMVKHGTEMPTDDIIQRDIKQILEDIGIQKDGNSRIVRTLAQLFRIFLSRR